VQAVPEPFLQYCAAPNPYMMGVTPAQFALINEELELGEITLVNCDEGCVAAAVRRCGGRRLLLSGLFLYFRPAAAGGVRSLTLWRRARQ